MFQRLFGGGSKSSTAPISSNATNRTVDAIQKLQETSELLEKRKEVLEKKIAAELEKAKQCLRVNNRSGAQAAMKRKALLQNQLETLENNMMRIIEQQQLLENSQATVQTVAALQQSAQAQKANMSEFKIEKVDKVMEEIQEAAEQATEIQQALAMPLGPAAEFDEDALESELAELEEQEAASKLDAELLAPARVPTAVPGGEMRLPDVPTTVPAIPSKAQKTTEDELEDLMKELTA